MFWTVNHQLFGQATLCDRCALLSINAATSDIEVPTFASVEEALVIINMACAVAELEPLEMTSSVTGSCGHCTTEVAA